MTFEQNYTVLDRWVHRLAFSGRAVQQVAADMEAMMFGARYRDVEVERPVFVTSLPRAGTTLLLEVIHTSLAFATHSYRDMPFVFAPMLWRALSGGFQRRAELAERAHGDGMKVGYDSPEAFEEVLWRSYWPGKYSDLGIELWQEGDDAPDFEPFFRDHMKKIVALNPREDGGPVRYLSKNNANVARLGLLRRLFPDAVLLVPFREPVAQAASLLHQHRRFLEVHEKEPFSRRYMEDIGHLEFGALHRPLLFPGMAEALARYSPTDLDYWVAYWVHAFEHLLEHHAKARFLSYERACADRDRTIRVLAAELGVGEELFSAVPTDVFRVPNPAKEAPADAALARRAMELHEACSKLSVV